MAVSLKWLSTLSVSLMLVGCATQVVTPESVETSVARELATLGATDDLAGSLELAGRVEQLIDAGQTEIAAALAAQALERPHDPEGYLAIARAGLQAANMIGNTRPFLRPLNRTIAVDSENWNPQALNDLYRLRSQVSLGLGDPVSALQDLVFAGETQSSILFPIAQQAATQLGPDAQLTPSEADGWIALSQVPGAPEPESAFAAWLRQWPGHIARENLPQALQAFAQTLWPDAQKIGIILPLSGPLAGAGQTLLDGIAVAQLNNPTTEFVVADGNQGVQAALNVLLAAQVDLILGPLPKGQVRTLMQLNPGVPVLALNYTEEQPESPLGPRAQMGLSPEDAARNAAEFMAAEVETPARALVFVPGDEIGDRLAGAFNDAWVTLGGVGPIEIRTNAENLRAEIAGALGITESEARRRSIARLVGEDVEFTPRRRQDITGVYVYSDSITAAQIKPLLAFYFASDLPVWLADTVLDGDLDLVRSDLTGAKVVAMPWQIGQPETNVLFELGVDAWTLATTLPRLDTQAVAGRTGEWSLAEDGRLTRSLTPADLTENGLIAQRNETPES